MVKDARRPAVRFHWLTASGAAAALGLSCATPAWAIPSPELVVGSLVSLSQLLALGSALLGGGAVYATSRARRNGSRLAIRTFQLAAAAMLILLCGSIGLNVYQYVERNGERQARLEETLVRPARTPGGLRSDPEIRELTYPQQVRHPNGISTAEAEALMRPGQAGADSDVVFIDVRERAERETGTIKGARFVRFPDFAAAEIDLTGKRAVLFCHNGDRSHEICDELKRQGIDCKFIVGGLEKWLAEGRAVDALGARAPDRLRALPRYPNDRVLLDTAAVRRLMASDKAVFVDVRYPAEFGGHGRLPDAISLPIRRIQTPDLPKAIGEIPKRPVILPCYDRRGCFFAEVAGLELSRAGYDVRGRYTEPWLYFVPGGRPPHVDTWLAEQNRSLWGKAAVVLAGWLAGLSQWIGVAGAILLLALISRLLILPFSLKAERDQIRSRAAAAELDGIKAKLKDDPVRKTRAIRAFYRRHGLTPGRNLVALLFLPIMAVAVMAVQELAAQAGEGLWWLPDLAVRDPLRILPLAFAALITLYIDLAFATTWKQRAIIWVVSLPLMFATGTLFSAAGDLYLVASAALLLLQRLWATGEFANIWNRWKRWRLPAGVVPLGASASLAAHGNKAHRLSQMRAAGLPVPDGLLLTPPFLSAVLAADPARRERLLDTIWNWLGRRKLAVRSSGANEDGASQSFAGVFELVLNIERAGLEGAINTVIASYAAERVGSYMSHEGRSSVLLQQMVDAEYAGVLFTRDPAAHGLMLVELVQGTGQDLVSGLVRPQIFRFGRVTKAPYGDSSPPIDLGLLLALADEAERLFGRPQDIEWTYVGGRFYLVQSRDITRALDNSGAAAEGQIAQVFDQAKGAPADEIVFARNELSEMLPHPTPLSLSFMEAMWAPGGSIDMATRRLRLGYPADEDFRYLLTIQGRLYVDKREEKRRALQIGPLAAKRLMRQADRIEREFRDEFLPEFLAELRLAAVADFDKLSRQELLAEVARLWRHFLAETHVEVDVINVAAQFYLGEARQALTAAGIDPSAVLGHIPETIEGHALAEIAAAPVTTRRWLMLKHFGHRAVFDYELADPRFAEDVAALDQIVAARAPRPATAEADGALSPKLARCVDIARRFQTLKEDAKHHSLRELAVLRRALLVLDRCFGFDGALFYLSFEQLQSLSADTTDALRETAARRHEQIAALRKLPALPSALTARDLELASAGRVVAVHETPDGIHGTRVAGSRVAEGRACVVPEDEAEQPRRLLAFRDGDIIVAAMISPAWLPYFARAGGFVCELGGWLSHPAILAREYDVPMIVGTNGIGHVADGTLIRLHSDGRVEVVKEASERQEAAA